MGLELLFLLLPVAALSGWVAGRRRSRRDSECSELPSDYFRGLNYLLNEQPDKAIEVFIRLIEIDSETVETHIAVGSLFRRRGEVDRAIRIHQNLIARPNLSREARAQALYELGEDYLKAGLLDRAESLFVDLADRGIHSERVLLNLLDIYQQEKEWLKAVEVALRVQQVSGRLMGAVVAQHYCELAEVARRGGESGRARRMVQRALESHAGCVRASLLEGALALESEHWRQAIRAYRRVEQQDPAYLPEVVEPLLTAYRAVGEVREMVDWLRHVLNDYGNERAMEVLMATIQEQDGPAAALAFMHDYSRRHPSLRALRLQLELKQAQSEGAVKEALEVIAEPVEQLAQAALLYRCERCGFGGRQLHWLCPGCKSWGTVKPE